MDDKPRFIAKSTKVDTKALTVNKDASSNGLSVPDVPNIPTFDLDQLNLVELSRQLKDALNQPEPFFMFTSRRRNEKLRLGKERLEVILDTIERVRSVNQSLAHARAEILLSKAVTESLINNYFNEAILMADLRKAEHDNSVSKHHHELRAREIQLDAAELANLKTKAEINLMEAKTEAENAWAALIKSTVENINFKNMPPALQYSVIQAIATKGTASTNPVLEEEINKFFKQQREAEAGKAMHEMRKVGAEADMAEMDVQINKQHMDNLKK